MDNWIEVFWSDDTIEAQILAKNLEQHGLSPHLLNPNLAALVGMGGVGLPCRVIVKPEEAERAKEVIRKRNGSKVISSEEEPINCPECNKEWEPGFRVCWHCETEI
jgi:hypothetical protein